MTDNIWPRFAFEEVIHTPEDSSRPFRCVLLMPIGPKRFDDLAAALKQIVEERSKAWLPTWEVPHVERLDWVQSGGAIQHQLWERLAAADLIFCDLTGQNPNVMFEAGVCAAWKRPEQVIFLRDSFYKTEQPFDIQPYRYLSYEITSDGVLKFKSALNKMLEDTMARFPDRLVDPSIPPIQPPVVMNFSDNRDDRRLLTPPLSHRRVWQGHFEFGSLSAYPHSWASIGSLRPNMFALSFDAKFTLRRPGKDHGFIGVGFHSQNVLVPFCHAVGLHLDGSVKLAQLDDAEPTGHRDRMLRGPQPIAIEQDHHFEVVWTATELRIVVDEFEKTLPLEELGKLLGPGLIRFQSSLCRMAISQLALSVQDEGAPFEA